MADEISRWWRLVWVLAGTFVLGGASFAQAPTPGDIRQSLPTPPQTERPTVPPATGAQPAPPQIPAGGPRVTIQRFEFEGNTEVPTADLEAAVAEFQGQSLDLFEVYGIADRLTRLYRQRGFPLATVAVPPQKISDGIIKLEVIEVRLGEVTFEGNESYRSEFLASWIDDLEPGTVLTSKALEGEMLQLNDLPGLSARAVVRPGQEYGTSDVVVQSTEDRWSGSVRFDNHGRETVGEHRYSIDLFVNNPARIGDELLLSFSHSEGDRLNYGRAQYSAPVFRWGTRVTGSVSRFTFDVDESVIIGGAPGDIRGDGFDARLQAMHPVIRSRLRNLNVHVAGSRIESDQTNKSPAIGRTAKEQFLNLAEVGFRFDQIHRDNSATDFSVVASSAFEGTFKRNGPGGAPIIKTGGAQKLKVRLDASHLRRVYRKLSLFVRAAGVLAIDPLPDLTRFRVGGPNSVRGFPSAEISGDQGFFASIEASHPLPTWNKIRSVAKVFGDYGFIDNKPQTRLVDPTLQAKQSLTSVGVGLAVSFPHRITFDLEVVRPLTNGSSTAAVVRPGDTVGRSVSGDGRNDARIWASLSAAF